MQRNKTGAEGKAKVEQHPAAENQPRLTSKEYLFTDTGIIVIYLLLHTCIIVSGCG